MRWVPALLVPMLACSFDGVDPGSTSDAARPAVDAAVPDAQPPPDAQLMVVDHDFQQGTGGYAGTFDAILSGQNPGDPGGNFVTIEWDLEINNIIEISLLRFAGVFGGGPRQVPPGAEILSATLSINVVNAGVDPQGTIHPVLIPWDESASLLSFSAGARPTVGVEVGPSLGVAPIAAGLANIDVTATVASWSEGSTANHGWAFIPNSMDSVQATSSEGGPQQLRPRLQIQARY